MQLKRYRFGPVFRPVCSLLRVRTHNQNMTTAARAQAAGKLWASAITRGDPPPAFKTGEGGLDFVVFTIAIRIIPPVRQIDVWPLAIGSATPWIRCNRLFVQHSGSASKASFIVNLGRPWCAQSDLPAPLLGPRLDVVRYVFWVGRLDHEGVRFHILAG